MFNEKDVELTDEELRVIKQQLLLDALDMMREADFPIEDTAETAEELFENILSEAQDNGHEARYNVLMAVASLRNDVSDDHPVNKYTKKLIGSNYAYSV